MQFGAELVCLQRSLFYKVESSAITCMLLFGDVTYMSIWSLLRSASQPPGLPSKHSSLARCCAE